MAVPNISRSHVIQKVLQNNFYLPLFILISVGEKSPPPFFCNNPIHGTDKHLLALNLTTQIVGLRDR